MQHFRHIEAWQLARAFTAVIYKVTRQFPPEERYGLTLQLRRSTVSIGGNIAEAFGRGSRADCARCLQTSISESDEALHHLITSNDAGYLSAEEFNTLEEQVIAIRHKLTNLVLRIRPAWKRRRKRSARRAAVIRRPKDGGTSPAP